MSLEPQYRLRRRSSDWSRSSARTSLGSGRRDWWRQKKRLPIPLRLLLFVAGCALMAVLFSGCGNGGPVSECAWVEPILLAEGDLLTEETALALLTHNEQWESICK